MYPIRRRCVTSEYCISRKRFPFKGECRAECPPRFTNINPYNGVTSNTTCYKCVVNCLRRCEGGDIDSLGTAESLKGCQNITGSLDIRIRSGAEETIQLLEQYLGDIEEITGYLKVDRSPAITSLKFFRNLRLIRGIVVFMHKYTFILNYNENLQEIWNFKEKAGFQLLNGSLMLHENRKLCSADILRLQTELHTNPKTDFINFDSNGYAETCVAQNIQSDAEVLSGSNVTIIWERFRTTDTQKVAGYTIYYAEAPEQNVSYVGIETCGR